MYVVTKCVAAPAGQNNGLDTVIQFVTAFFLRFSVPFSIYLNIAEYM